MKKDIMLIANYWHFAEEKLSSRYRSMAELISQNGYSLEVVTSSFRHQTKKQRNAKSFNLEGLKYKVILINEPGYKNNISIKRLYSHNRFAKNVLRYLKKRKHADLIIVSVPSLSVGNVVTKFANKNNIKVVIDIQDLWPEAFRMAINVPILSSILFMPMILEANRIYSRADEIIAVSKTYVDRAIKENKRAEGTCIYIGSDPELFAASEGIKIDKIENEFWIGYVGALGYSYDIPLIIDVLKDIKEKGIENIVFKVMGDGPLKDDFILYAKKKEVCCDFMGFLPYSAMMANLKKCDIAVNPIIKESVSTVINKVSDYAMAGLPVINTQKSKEYRDLIDEYGCGINCMSGDVGSVRDAVLMLYNNEHVRAIMHSNAKRLAKEKFDRSNTYKDVINICENLMK